MTNPEALLLILFGVAVGAWLSHLTTWRQARKIEDLVRGGLRAWDEYDIPNRQAKGQVHDFSRSSDR